MVTQSLRPVPNLMHQSAPARPATTARESPVPDLPRTTDEARPRSLGVLSNGRSGRNQKGGLQTARRILAGYGEVPHHEVSTPEEIGEALRELSGDETEVLAVNGGDGTVQAVLSSLLRDRPFSRLPLLAVIPSGTTNMTAGDIGVGRHPGRSLRRLLRWTQARETGAVIESRPVLRVLANPTAVALYGMFFGTAGIVQGTRYFHERIHAMGLRGELGPGITIARLLLDAARRRGQHVTPESIRVQVDDRTPEQHDWLLILVSTLQRLFLGLRPYWGRERAPLQYTALGARPRYLLRVLPWLARGRTHRRLTASNGYYSYNAREVRLTLDSAFTLDGEIIAVDRANGPVLLQDGGDVRFLRL